MNKEFAERWVADLRDPNNKQCSSVLHDGVGYCCLGRALVVGGFKLVPRQNKFTGKDQGVFAIDGSQDEEGLGGEYETLDDRTKDELGFYTYSGYPKEGTVEINGVEYPSLAEANDAGITFAQISDWVEKNWERL